MKNKAETADVVEAWWAAAKAGAPSEPRLYKSMMSSLSKGQRNRLRAVYMVLGKRYDMAKIVSLVGPVVREIVKDLRDQSSGVVAVNAKFVMDPAS